MTITDFKWVGLGSPGAYLLENDGTDSIFHYSATFPDAGATWTNEPITGVYTKIRVGSTAGQVYILSLGDGTTVTDTFLDGDGSGPWIEVPFDAGFGGCTDFTMGTYNAGADRFEATYCADADGKLQRVQWNFGTPTLVDSVSMTVEYDATFSSVLNFFSASILMDGVNVEDDAQGSPSSGTVTINFNTPTSVTMLELLSTAFTNPGDGYSYITQITVTYTDNGTVKTRYSANYGASFAAPRPAGDAPGDYTGFDTQKIGSVAMVGANGQVMATTTAGGSFSAYGDPLPAGFQPSAIVIPRYKSNGTSNSSSTPDYVVASNLLTGDDEGLLYVSAGGTVFTDITPSIGGDFGVAVSSDCIDNSFRSGLRYAAVLDFDGLVSLVTSASAGSVWLDRGGINGGLSVKYRRGDLTKQQLYISCAGGLIVSQNHGANIQTRLSPGTLPLLGAEPMG